VNILPELFRIINKNGQKDISLAPSQMQIATHVKGDKDEVQNTLAFLKPSA
jgi:hypothetical protein